jgi:hypothetical protein
MILGFGVGLCVAQILGAQPLSNEEVKVVSSTLYLCMGVATIAGLFAPIRMLGLSRQQLFLSLVSLSCASGALTAGSIIPVFAGLMLHAFLMTVAFDSRNWKKRRAQ